MTAERKRAEQPSGGPLGFGSQYLWHTSQHIVDMAMPAPAPLPVTVACDCKTSPSTSAAPLSSSLICRMTSAPKEGGLITSASTTSPIGRRSRHCSSFCQCCAKLACL